MHFRDGGEDADFVLKSAGVRRMRILASMTDSRRPVPSKQNRPPLVVSQPRAAENETEERWVGLREAEDLTGIPASTIRNWARKQRIESRFELDESGDRRDVEINEVVAWADHLGRQHRRVASREPRVASDRVTGEQVAGDESLVEPEDVADPESRVASEDVAGPASRIASEEVEGDVIEGMDLAGDEVEATRDEPLATRDRAERSADSAEDSPRIPEGTMLVPLDAWNKMLNQLGNLHEAGQQLAEARERAAKAETEVQFLRERLADLRTTDPTTPPLGTAPPEAASIDDTPEPLWVDLYRRWNRRRR
jgi:hypothetical protein